MALRKYDVVMLNALMDMRGDFGPTQEELDGAEIHMFDDALSDTRYEIDLPHDQVFAAVCGDGRLDENGLRYNRGYFAFGGGYMSVLGEALANPDTILAKGLRLDTHAHERLRLRHAQNPLYKFVWHTDDHAGESSIGCGLLKGRMVVLERLASGEFASFVAAGNQLGHTELTRGNPLIGILNQNARKLLDGNYLNVSDASLRQVPEDIKNLTVEERLIGTHNEKRWKIETRLMQRTRTSEIWPQFDGWQAFVSSAWAQAFEAQDWMHLFAKDAGESAVQELADAQNNAMGLITMAGIATLGNKRLAAVVPVAQ